MDLPRTIALQFRVLTIFPELFSGFCESSLIGKASQRGLVQIQLDNIRDYAAPPHFRVDDYPYGGGAGMVMKPDPLVAAIETAKLSMPQALVVILSAGGRLFTQEIAHQYCKRSQIILVCGRYEGIDQRAIDLCADEEVSIGDYVLMGGEVPAMVVIEATARLLSDVVGNTESVEYESFAPANQGLLEAPHYTRPPDFRTVSVPDILLSGDHQKIAKWKTEMALARTAKNRPDLLARLPKRKETD